MTFRQPSSATSPRAALHARVWSPDQVDQVVFGNVIHTSPGDMYGRASSASTPGSQGGAGVDRQPVVWQRPPGDRVGRPGDPDGDADVALAGGAESMSHGAYWVQNARWGARMADALLVDAVVGALTDPFNKIHHHPKKSS